MTNSLHKSSEGGAGFRSRAVQLEGRDHGQRFRASGMGKGIPEKDSRQAQVLSGKGRHGVYTLYERRLRYSEGSGDMGPPWEHGSVPPSFGRCGVEDLRACVSGASMPSWACMGPNQCREVPNGCKDGSQGACRSPRGDSNVTRRSCAHGARSASQAGSACEYPRTPERDRGPTYCGGLHVPSTWNGIVLGSEADGSGVGREELARGKMDGDP